MPIRLSRLEFERAVREALKGLPEPIRSRAAEVDVIVQDWPTAKQLADQGIDDRRDLLGLYEGLGTERGHQDTGAMPDRVLLFQRSIEESCDRRDELLDCIRETVIHEVGHHLGFDDDALDGLGLAE